MSTDEKSQLVLPREHNVSVGSKRKYEAAQEAQDAEKTVTKRLHPALCAPVAITKATTSGWPYGKRRAYRRAQLNMQDAKAQVHAMELKVHGIQQAIKSSTQDLQECRTALKHLNDRLQKHIQHKMSFHHNIAQIAPIDLLDQKCNKFWKFMSHCEELQTAERFEIHAMLTNALQSPSMAFLQSCLTCVLQGCERRFGDIQCTRCNFQEERLWCGASVAGQQMANHKKDLLEFLYLYRDPSKLSTKLWDHVFHLALRHSGIHNPLFTLAAEAGAAFDDPHMGTCMEIVRTGLQKECIDASVQRMAEYSDDLKRFLPKR